MTAEQKKAAPVLSVNHVVKAFGAKRAVDDVTLDVMPGDIFGFVGHNGAGKTTLIRAIVGVTGFDEGDIRIAGQSVKTDALACKRMTAYVPDNPDIYEFLTGIQYLNYLSDIFEVPADVRERRIRAYADRLSLTSALGDLISSYSHGMRQKLVLIGALVHQPTLLVLDEPFVGRPRGVLPREGDAARAGRWRLGRVLLQPRAGSGGEAVQQGGHHQAGHAARMRPDGRRGGRREPGGRVPRHDRPERVGGLP